MKYKFHSTLRPFKYKTIKLPYNKNLTLTKPR